MELKVCCNYVLDHIGKFVSLHIEKYHGQHVDKLLLLAVAAVLSNWHNVLRAINMASSKSQSDPISIKIVSSLDSAKLPKPKEDDELRKKEENEPPLPQTLVRIPTQHAPALLEQANLGAIAD